MRLVKRAFDTPAACGRFCYHLPSTLPLDASASLWEARACCSRDTEMDWDFFGQNNLEG